jgi:hypothetical protein
MPSTSVVTVVMVVSNVSVAGGTTTSVVMMLGVVNPSAPVMIVGIVVRSISDAGGAVTTVMIIFGLVIPSAPVVTVVIVGGCVFGSLCVVPEVEIGSTVVSDTGVGSPSVPVLMPATGKELSPEIAIVEERVLNLVREIGFPSDPVVVSVVTGVIAPVG